LLNNLGEVARVRGELTVAEARYAEALAIHEQRADARATAIVQGNLGSVTRRLGRPREAASLLRASMALKHRLGDDIGTAYNLAGLGCVLADVGAYRDAARLLGAAEKLLRDRGVTLDAADRVEASEVTSRCRASLGEHGFEAAWAQGWGVGAGRAVAIALEATEHVAPDEA
jgi:tetratricopeptide (TPR) repeat protein